jgi:hypothetical protein
VASIKAGLAALADPVETRIDPIAAPFQPMFDAVAPAFGAARGALMAVGIQPLRPAFAACIYAFAAPVQPLFDAIAAGIPALLDAIAAVAGMGQTGAQQQGQGKQDHRFHRAVSLGW